MWMKNSNRKFTRRHPLSNNEVIINWNKIVFHIHISKMFKVLKFQVLARMQENGNVHVDNNCINWYIFWRRIWWAIVKVMGEGNGTPLQYSCLENPMDGGAWSAVHGVPTSQTRLSDFTLTFHFHALEKETATDSTILPGKSQGWGTWWAAVYGVTQSRTQLKRLSSKSDDAHACEHCYTV